MSKVRSLFGRRHGWPVASVVLALILGGVALPRPALSQTVPAGSFKFSSAAYAVTENESAQAPLANPVFPPTLNFRSVRGVVITVLRENGTAGRVHVPYASVDIDGTCGDTNSTQAVPECDYQPVFGELVFDDFETSKSFVIPVFSDGALSGNKQFDITIGPVTLDASESPDIIPPTIENPNTTVTIIEINQGNMTLAPAIRGTNFVIERKFYAVDEDERTITVDVLQPSGTSGDVRWELLGSDRPGWSLNPASDYAHPVVQTHTNPTYTDGTTNFVTTQDFVLAAGTLQFAQGQRRRSVVIQILDDDVVEFNEDLLIRLIPVGGQNPGLGANSSANVKILYQETPAGSLDREWNRDNVASTTPRFNPAPGANNPVRAVAVQDDDRTIIGGDFTAFNSAPRNRLARVNGDGSLDVSFEPGTGADDFVSSIALYPAGADSAGKILIAGGFTSYNGIQRNGIARVNPNGSLDGTFAVGTGANGVVRAVGIQADEKVIIVGEFTTVNGLPRGGVARLNADGSVDTSFDPGSGADGPVLALAVAAGRVYVAGDFMVFGGEFRARVARLTDAGVVDLTFDPGGGADGPIHALALQNDGRLLMGGAFATFDFRNRSGLARLENSGTLDTSYDPGSGANDAVFSIALQSDGKAFVGGQFTDFNHTRRVGLTRLFVNGKVDTSFLDTAYNQFAGVINDLYYQPRNAVNAIALQSDGKVMIGGQFYQVGGNPSVETVPGSRPEWVSTDIHVWNRAEKRARANLARLMGGYTPGPGNVEFSLAQNTVDENSPILTVPLQRIDGQLGAIGVVFGTTNGLATSGSDFDETVGNVIWPQDALPIPAPILLGAVGERYNFQVPIAEDASIEGDETFGLGITTPVSAIRLGGEIILTGGALGRSSSSATIVDNDFNRGEFEFSASVYTTNENAGVARVTVVRRNGSVGPVSVKYFTRDETAIAGSDYTFTQGTLTFGSGVTSQSFGVPLRDDLVIEADKTFQVVLTNATGGAIIQPGGLDATTNARVRIVDNDIPSGRIGLYTATPPTAAFSTNEGAGFAQIVVERLGGAVGQLSVVFTATNGTAIAGTDFVGVTNTLTWVHGDVVPKIVSIPLIDNSTVGSPTKTVSLRLSNPSVAGAVGVAAGTLTITEDDAAGRLSFSRPSYDVDERGTNVWITVVRQGGVGGTITVNYQAVNGTAINGTHFTLAAGSLTFGPGVVATNFVVTLLDNTNLTGTLDATLRLTGASATGTYPTAAMHILDDETIGDPAGSLDATFNPLAGGNDSVNAVALQPDGRILAAGSFRMMNRVSRTRVARLLTDGTLDESFDVKQGPNAPVRAMVLQGERVVIGGQFTQVAGTNRNYIARLLADGTLDRFFNPGGGADAPVLALAALPDGGVVLGGGFASVNGISRPGVAILNSNGTVRAGFSPGVGVAGTVLALAVQPDGRIIIGGEFCAVDGIPAPNLARLLANGAVDTTFNVGQGPNGAVRAIALQPDGAIVIGGSFTQVDGVDRGRIARLTAGGALDTLFQNAVAGANSDVLGLALQYDGKVIVVGEFTRFNDVSRNRITRLNQNGKTDTSINFGLGADKAITAAVIQDDRRIILGGRFTSFDGMERLYLTRVHGGSISGSGHFQFDSPYYFADESQHEAIISVLRRGGMAGEVTIDYASAAGTATPNLDYTNIVGTLTFAEGEFQRQISVPIVNDGLGEDPETVSLSLSNPSAGDLGVVPEATLIIVSDDSGIGFASGTFAVGEGVAGGQVQLTVNRSGATNEVSTVSYATVANGTATALEDFTPVSGILVFAPGEDSKTIIVPILDDGLIEPTETFSVVLTNATGSSSLQTATTVVSIVDNDFSPGTLMVASANYSVAENGGSVTVTVVRTNGVTGVVTVQYQTQTGTATTNDFVAKSGVVTFVEGQSVGTITITILDDAVVEGDEAFLVRLSNPTGGSSIVGPTDVTVTIVDEEVGPGSLDRTFDPGAGPNGLVRALSAAADGSVLIGGSFTQVGSDLRNYVARLTSSGSNDDTFDPGDGPNGLVSTLEVSTNDSVTIGGGFTSVDGHAANRVSRLLAAGDLDGTFLNNAGFNGSIHALALRPDGRAVVGGAFGLPGRGIIQLRSDGTVDTAFDPGGGADGPVHAVGLFDDGRVAIGGAFTSVDGVPRARLAVLRADGSLDTAVDPVAITNGTVYAVAVQPDGKVIAAGDFGTASGPVRIARFNTDGSIDNTFAVGTGANDIIFALKLDSTGRILIGGAFTTFNGSTRNRFARLNSNGSLDATLDPGPGANGSVLALDVLPTDDFLIAGDFTMVNGAVRNHIARILGGSLAGARFASAGTSGGMFNLQLVVVPGRRYALEVSSDLRQWSTARTTRATGNLWQVGEAFEANANCRFYRLRELP